MKIQFIIVRYKTPEKEINRLKKEIKAIGLRNFSMYVSDNTRNNVGFAAAVNRGIKKGLLEDVDLFVIVNQDISFKNIKAQDVLKTSEQFDIFGFAMKEGNINYYGGEIDTWRLSGGLIQKKPKEKFAKRDFVIGSLMGIKRRVLEQIGFFDESYFLYYEDVDYCIRARQKGFKIGINSKKNYAHLFLIPPHKNKEYLLAKNRVKFFLKYSSSLQKIREAIRFPKTIVEERKLLFTELSKNPFFLNFFSFNASSLFNKLFNFILFIFLIRNFSIQQYGIYTLVWAQVSLFSPLVDFGTTSYGLIYLPNARKNHIQTLISMRFFLSLVIFLLTILLSIIFKYEREIILYITLVSFTIFANMWSGSYLILTSVAQKNYKAAIISVIFNFFLILSTIIGLIVSKKLAVIFLIVFLFYNIYGVINISLVKREIGNLLLKFEFKKWLDISKKSSMFVLISLFAGLYFKLDILLLKFLKTEADIGIYSAGYKFFEAFTFIIAAYNFSATPVLVKLAARGKTVLTEQMRKDILFLFLLGLVVLFLSYTAAPAVLPFILKNDFQKSIEVFKIVILSLPFMLITTVFLNGLYVLKKAYLVILLFVLLTVMNFTLNLLFIPQFSYVASSYITVLSEVLSTLISGLLFLKAVKQR